MIKGILFDLDGTIVDTNELIIQSFTYVLNEYLGLKVSRQEIIKTFGAPLIETMRHYGGDRAEEITKVYIDYSHDIQSKYIRAYEHVEEGLIKLKKAGLKLAIVTSKRRTVALSCMNEFDLEKYFDVIVTPEDTKIHKPKGEPVLKACELLKLKPDETIMVGDSHNDILCGKNAGALTALVKYTALDLKELYDLKPDYSIDKIEELLKVV
ncbi:MAG: pyrophosphatase PpaX [Clostridium sp.]|nr:pyrophosphatase PpaX [Clostridium sp.]